MTPGRVVKLEGDHIEALEMRGHAYYHLADLEMASHHFREVLKYDPEHLACKKSYQR
jgi:hypothetical protein